MQTCRSAQHFHTPVYLRLAMYILSALCVFTLLVGTVYSHAQADTTSLETSADDSKKFAPIEDLSSQKFDNHLRVPSSSPIQEDLPVELSFTAPPHARFVQIKLELFNGANEMVAQLSNSWSNQKLEKISMLTNIKADEPEKLNPGIYTLKIKTNIRSAGYTLSYQQQAKIYRFDAGKTALPVSLIARMSTVPLHNANDEFEDQIYQKFKGEFLQLHQLLEEIKAHPQEKLTLSIPLKSLEDIQELAQNENFYDQSLMADILNLLQNLSLNDNIHLVYSGYNDPDLSMFTSESLREEVRGHYQRPPKELGEQLGMKIYQGVVARNLSLPHALIPEFAAAEVPWVVCLPSGLDPLARNAYSSELYHIHGAPHISVIKAYEKFLPSLQDDRLAELYERFLVIHDLPEQEQSSRIFVGVYPLSQNEEELVGFIDCLRFSSQQNWMKPSSLDELTALESEKTLNGISLSEYNISPLAQELEEASSYVQAMKAAKLEQNEAYYNARKQLILAQAGAWPELHENGLKQASQYAKNAQELAKSIFSNVSILGQDAHLSGKSGEVPFILKQEHEQKMGLSVTATGSPGLIVTDEKFAEGVHAGTAAGENYLSVPVKLVDNNLNQHSLTIKAYAGKQLVAQHTIVVEASRLDIIITLIALLIIFIVLLFILRYRLRHAGLARAFNNTQASNTKLNKVIEQIKREVYREAPSSKDDNPEGPVHEAGLSPRFIKRHGKTVRYAGDKIQPTQHETNEAEHQVEH